MHTSWLNTKVLTVSPLFCYFNKWFISKLFYICGNIARTALRLPIFLSPLILKKISDSIYTNIDFLVITNAHSKLHILLRFHLFLFLLVHINCTEVFHCDIFINAYNVLWSNSPLYYSFLSPVPLRVHYFSLMSFFCSHIPSTLPWAVTVSLTFLVMMVVTSLRTTGQIFCRVSHNLVVTDIFLIASLGFWISWRKISRVKGGSLHILCFRVQASVWYHWGDEALWLGCGRVWHVCPHTSTILKSK
jgi:hypothetical protein